MTEKKIWLVLNLSLGIAACWFVAVAGVALFRYTQLTDTIKPEVIIWGIDEQAEDWYLLSATYTFRLEKNLFQGKGVLKDPIFRNREIAEEALNRSKDLRQIWPIWYSTANPHISALEKRFPFKESFAALLLCGILLYFNALKLYVKSL